MTLYRETPCIECGEHHGYFNADEFLCDGPGGSREKMVIDYQAAWNEMSRRRALWNLDSFDLVPPEGGALDQLHFAKAIIDAALHTERESASTV